MFLHIFPTDDRYIFLTFRIPNLVIMLIPLQKLDSITKIVSRIVIHNQP